ncbi:MAG: lytic transglycosylase domain-containing protein [Pseudomonadales bacterium]|nr:lytic transglycosylase domain-containing protein [Pseudomonadales bacterium]MDP6469833.1 lytic transglycosylase domain-containing protein [Pseudomonadales bacterium]MDP6827565.1 lytic transglycosylase domain-containing protein [Pseudomonadales bacterium]MDP6971303.1 lytic transglycosylase domain-containing protein [Pseudomonadales bacterium]
MKRFALVLLACAISVAVHAAEAQPFQRCFELAARMHDVPLDLLMAVAATESNFDPDARSDANAHGIMQIQWPGTARHLGVRRVSELYNPCLNITLGARYLHELLERNDHDVQRTLASYNYGPTRIDAARQLPPSAMRYAESVHNARTRVRTAAAQSPTRLSSGVPGVLFDSATRARRFARTLNTMVENARFDVHRTGSGAHAVSMQVDEAGLTFADARTLYSLGWPETAP